MPKSVQGGNSGTIPYTGPNPVPVSQGEASGSPGGRTWQRKKPSAEAQISVRRLPPPASPPLAPRAHAHETFALRPLLNLADEILASPRPPADSRWQAVLSEYSRARTAANHAVGDTPERLRQAQAQLAKAARAVRALINSTPGRFGPHFDPLWGRLHHSNRIRTKAARRILPKTEAQEQIWKKIGTRTVLNPVGRVCEDMQAIHDLSLQVAADARRSQVPKNEKAYVRQALVEQSRAERVLTLHAPANLTPQEQQEYAAAERALAAARSAQLLETPQGDAADRFTRALKPVRALASLTDALLGKHHQVLEKRLLQIEVHQPRLERCAPATALVLDTAPEVLQSLPVARQMDLLRLTRLSSAYCKTSGGKFEAAQAKLYRAIQLDLTFLEAEKAERRNVITELLQQHRAKLLDARDRWPALDKTQRLEALTLIAHVHAGVMRFPKPNNVMLWDVPMGHSGGWERSRRLLLINQNGANFNDFECMLETVFHENSHNWQVHLTNQFKYDAPIRPELGTQALLFCLNLEYECPPEELRKERKAYRQQPMERHAYYTGPRFARALLRALAE
jgi:hypothetical protein